MQEVTLYDRSRKPSSWMEIIRPGQYAAFFSDVETGTEMSPAGVYLAPGMTHSCLIFDSLTEAANYCRQRVEEVNGLQCDVFDSQGRANPPVAVFVHKRYETKLDSEAKANRMMWWSVVVIASSLPWFWFTWRSHGESWWLSFFGLQIVLIGMRLLHWGYSLLEEVRYRESQADQRAQQNAAASMKSGDPQSA